MILVTGSLAFDHIMNFPGRFSDHILPDKIHILNVSFLVKELRKGFGGTAGNIAYTLSLLGIRSGVMGVAGGDFVTYREFLEKNEVDTSYVKLVDNLFTSTAFGITDIADNQIWGFYTGADILSEELSIYDVERKIDFGIIAPHNPRAMLKFAKEYQKLQISYMFDPGMQLPWLTEKDLKEALKGAKVIIGNDYEMTQMKKKLKKEMEEFAKQDKIIITTLGEKGSRIVKNGKVIFIKPAKVRSASDPTGAGDTYRAGFIAGYMRGFSPQVCGQMGSVSAAYTVEKYGTTTHVFTLEQFCKRYKQNYGEEIEL